MHAAPPRPPNPGQPARYACAISVCVVLPLEVTGKPTLGRGRAERAVQDVVAETLSSGASHGRRWSGKVQGQDGGVVGDARTECAEQLNDRGDGVGGRDGSQLASEFEERGFAVQPVAGAGLE